MSQTSTHPHEHAAIAQDERWALVLRVIASRQFGRAPQLRDILTYICQRGLTEPGALIKEHEIACNALGRKADFNPNEDNIVRVQISHLRKRLDEYFASEGKDELLQITIPKGGYVPSFQANQQAIAPPPAVAIPQKRSSVPILLAIIGILVLLCLYFALRPSISARTRAPEPPPAAQDPFWARIFGGSQPAEIVVADSCLVMLQDFLHTDISLDEYVRGQFPGNRLQTVTDPSWRAGLQTLSTRQYTSLADLTMSLKLIDLSRQFGPNQARVRYARHLNGREFKSGNFVLNGSRRAIAWVGLFDGQLNFTMEEDKKSHMFYFRNKAPKPGEQATYFPNEKGGTVQTYADIALVPNLGNNGSVLLISGIAMVGTEAGGELLTRKDAWKELSRIIGADTVRDRYFELLVKTRAVAGEVSSSEIVTYRVIRPNPSSP